MSQMKLGWWRDRGGREHKVDMHYKGRWPWYSSTSDRCWPDNGLWEGNGKESNNDLIEFIRPLDTELPPTLNSAVKAAEDRVRAWKTHHAAAQKLADDALYILEEAKRELERLEKECEVKP